MKTETRAFLRGQTLNARWHATIKRVKRKWGKYWSHITTIKWFWLHYKRFYCINLFSLFRELLTHHDEYAPLRIVENFKGKKRRNKRPFHDSRKIEKEKAIHSFRKFAPYYLQLEISLGHLFPLSIRPWLGSQLINLGKAGHFYGLHGILDVTIFICQNILLYLGSRIPRNFPTKSFKTDNGYLWRCTLLTYETSPCFPTLFVFFPRWNGIGFNCILGNDPRIGTLKSRTASTTKTSPQNIAFHYRKSFVNIYAISFASYNVGEVPWKNKFGTSGFRLQIEKQRITCLGPRCRPQFWSLS